MGIPVRRFAAPNSQHQPKRRRSSVAGDAVAPAAASADAGASAGAGSSTTPSATNSLPRESDYVDVDSDAATDSAPEWSVQEMLARVDAMRRTPNQRRRMPYMVRGRELRRERAAVSSGSSAAAEAQDNADEQTAASRVRLRRRWFMQSARGRFKPHDLATRRGRASGGGVDIAAISEVVSYYSGAPASGSLHLCKSVRADSLDTTPALCVIYVDESARANADVAPWWTVGSWAFRYGVTPNILYHVLVTLMQKISSIPDCRINKLVVCDDLQQCRAVRGALWKLRFRPVSDGDVAADADANAEAPAPDADNDGSSARTRSVNRDEHHTPAPPPPTAEWTFPDTDDNEYEGEIEGKFSHPVSGDVVEIVIA